MTHLIVGSSTNSSFRIALAAIAFTSCSAAAQSTNVSAAHKHAWGENIGWTNWRDANSGSQGVVAHRLILSGYAWCENFGWLTFGDGSPANNIQYSNTNGLDAGVNIDEASGDLSGFAWGENIGWINFNTRSSLGPYGQHARLDLFDGRLRGYAWGENIGWINLDDATHYIAFDGLCYPDCDQSTGPRVLDIFDFLCFGNRFAVNDPYACDCDVSTGPGVCDIFDFLCFGNAFNQGCP